MSWNTTRQLRARFESLEQRQLLAGDVVISMARGDLVIQGDDADNHIAITAGAEAGSLVITGLNGTTVHLEGEAAATSVTIDDFHGGARVGLGIGNDTLEVAEVSLRGGVSIRTGEGNDSVMIGADANGGGEALAGLVDTGASVDVRGSLRIDTDGGEDNVVVDSVTVRGTLEIHTGTENDSVALGNQADVAGTALNGTGNFGDEGTDSDARLKIRGGASVHLGDGNDSLEIQHVSARFSAIVHAGAGDDTVSASLSNMFGLSVLGDDGADHVRANGLNARFLSIFTGDGNDNVEVLDSAFASLSVALGSGDDVLATTDVEARLAFLFGGIGQDTFNQLGVDEFLHDVINGFELPELIASPIGRPGFGVLPPIGGGVGHRI